MPRHDRQTPSLSGPSTCCLSRHTHVPDGCSARSHAEENILWLFSLVLIFVLGNSHFISLFYKSKASSVVAGDTLWRFLPLRVLFCLSGVGENADLRPEVVTTHLLRSIAPSDSLQKYLYLPTSRKNKESGDTLAVVVVAQLTHYVVYDVLSAQLSQCGTFLQIADMLKLFFGLKFLFHVVTNLCLWFWFGLGTKSPG